MLEKSVKLVATYRRNASAAVVMTFCIAGALLLAACQEDRVAGGSVSTQTGTKVNLSGRVVDKNNAGIAGLVVELQRAGLKDTTDAQGRYLLKGPLENGDKVVTSALTMAAHSDSTVLDSLLVKEGDQEIVSLAIFRWVDSLPDIQIIQRNISGKLLSAPSSIGRIEAVISGEGIPDDQAVVVPMYHFMLSSSFTGFAHFMGTATAAEYVLFVRVLDTSDRLIGQSPLVSFSTMAGNIPVPDFDAGNALPKPNAGKDTELLGGGKVTFRGTATDAFGGWITRLEWDLGGTGIFRETTGDTTLILPGSQTLTYPAILRAWDNDGNSALDTVIVRTVASARCDPLAITFNADGQSCTSYWTADATGLSTTIAFEVGDTLIVKVLGSPVGLPMGYAGPYPPAAQYIGTFKAQGKKGTTQVKVKATRSDGSTQYYNTWTITRY